MTPAFGGQCGTAIQVAVILRKMALSAVLQGVRLDAVSAHEGV